MDGRKGLYAAIKPLYSISKILGLAPFHYSINPSTNLEYIHPKKGFGISRALWSVILVLIIAFSFTLSMRHKMSYSYKTMAAKAIVADICTSILLFGSTLSTLVLELTFSRRKLQKILSKVSMLDERLLQESMRLEYRKMFWFLVMEIVLAFFFLTALFSIVISAHGADILVILPEILAHAINLVNVLQFMNVELLLRTRYMVLNKQIPFTLSHCCLWTVSSHTQLMSQVEGFGKMRWHISPIQQISQIRSLRELHSHLFDITELVEYKYGFPVLMELASDFVALVSTLYTAMVFMKTQRRIEDLLYFHKFVAFIFWTLLYLAKAGVITVSCHAASKEANKSISVVQKMLLKQPLTAHVSTELHLYLMQLCNNRVDFTACGFFSVNLSLLHAIVGATATYIIILIQLN